MKLIKTSLWIAAVLLAGGLAFNQVLATRPPIQEVPHIRICHRTNSVTNPYESISVPYSAIDGEGNNDHSQHTGPVATSQAVAQALKDAKTKWGDVIPPVEGVTPGLNWSTAGQAIWNNQCKYVPAEEPGDNQPPVDQPPVVEPPITTAPHDPDADKPLTPCDAKC